MTATIDPNTGMLTHVDLPVDACLHDHQAGRIGGHQDHAHGTRPSSIRCARKHAFARPKFSTNPRHGFQPANPQATPGETGVPTGVHVGVVSYYDPTTAQFTTPDPFDALTGSRYGYADNDPINGSDPTGLFCVVHNSDGGCLGAGVAEDAASYGASWVPDCVTIGNNNCTNLATTHPIARDTLYVTAGAAATVASGGLALDAVGAISLGTGSLALAGEGVASVGVGLTAAYGDYGRCRAGDQLACAGMWSGAFGAAIGIPALIPGWGALGVAGLPYALGGLAMDEYGLYKGMYDRLVGGGCP